MKGSAMTEANGLTRGSSSGRDIQIADVTLASGFVDGPGGQNTDTEHFDVVILGGGQAGLATGYHLARRGIGVVIVDAYPSVGDSWRNRWDSLKLFTPARYAGLPGKPFPAPPYSFPSAAEVATYLEAYAAEMNLPVRSGIRVDRVTPLVSEGKTGFLVHTSGGVLKADQVVVATGGYQKPNIPPFAGDLSPDILQFHSSEYRNPSQLREGPVLVVGASTSGAEIALEASRGHRTLLSGRHPGQLLFRIDGPLAPLMFPLIWFAWNRAFTINNPLGRKARPYVRHRGGPLFRIKLVDLEVAGVERFTLRTVGTREGKPMLEDGRALYVTNVIWCTGFRDDYDWIDGLPIGDDGYPVESQGTVPELSGLHFVGLKFQRSIGSMLIGGVGRDAALIAEGIAAAQREDVPWEG
jgi:putative flavoprotein involved in K+ transport